MEQLMADSIINDEIEQVLEYLRQLSEHAESVEGWEIKGLVYLEFLHISEEMKSLSDEITLPAAEELLTKLIDLCHRILQVPTPSVKEVLCQAEMSKRIAAYIRTVVEVKSSLTNTATSFSTIRDVAQCCARLPMPEDYSISEYRHLVHTYTAELANL
eukprot:Em0022g327a